LSYQVLASDNKATSTVAKDRGHAVGLDYFYNTSKLDINLGLQDLSSDFDTRIGYMTRNGLSRIRADITPKFYLKQSFIRRVDFGISSAQIKDKPSELYETYNGLSLRFFLRQNANLSLGANYSTEIFLGEKFKTGGWNISGSSQLTKQFFFRLSYRNGKAIRFAAAPFQGKGSNASANFIYQPSDKLNANLSLIYSDFFRDANSERIFDITIFRGRLTYQLNRYLFLRAIAEHNNLRQRLLTDFLASFTYIPGTVLHFGYGSIYEKDILPNDGGFAETRRGFFAKASYLWRL